MSRTRPYPKQDAYTSLTELAKDKPEIASQKVANTDNTKSSEWITSVLEKHQNDPVWQPSIESHQVLRKIINSWTPTATKITAATENFAKCLGGLTVTEASQKDIQNLVALFKGLYARGVWLDGGKEWGKDNDPLREGNKERVTGSQREQIYGHLWEAGKVLERKLQQFNAPVSVAATTAHNTAEIFTQILSEEQVTNLQKINSSSILEDLEESSSKEDSFYSALVYSSDDDSDNDNDDFVSTLSHHEEDGEDEALSEPSMAKAVAKKEMDNAPAGHAPIENQRATLLIAQLEIRNLGLKKYLIKSDTPDKKQFERLAVVTGLTQGIEDKIAVLKKPNISDQELAKTIDQLSRILKSGINEISGLGPQAKDVSKLLTQTNTDLASTMKLTLDSKKDEVRNSFSIHRHS